MTQRLRISFLAQARFDNLIRGAAKITKEVMKSHGCAFQFCLSYGSFQCPCLQFFHMELSRRKVPVYVSTLISLHTGSGLALNECQNQIPNERFLLTGSTRALLFLL